MRPPTPSPGAHRLALSITLKLSLPGHHATGLKQNPRKCSFNKRENHKQETQMPIKPRRGRRSNTDQQGLGLQNHGGVKAQKSVTWTQWRARASKWPTLQSLGFPVCEMGIRQQGYANPCAECLAHAGGSNSATVPKTNNAL